MKSGKTKKKSPRRSIKRFSLLLFGLIIGLVAAEILMRVLPKDFLKINFSIPGDMRIYHPSKHYEYKYNVTRNWSSLGPPTLWHFNNIGFRDRPVQVDKSQIVGNLYRIMFVGDSMVMGLGVEDYEALPRQLENELNPKEYKAGVNYFEVLNLGLWGYGTTQYELVVKEFDNKLDPDLIIVGIFTNDHLEAAYNERNRTYIFFKSLPDTMVPYRLNDYLKKHSYLYLFLLTKYNNLVEPLNSEVEYSLALEDEGWEISAASLARIDKITGSKTPVLVVRIPNINEVYSRADDRYIKSRKKLTEIMATTTMGYLDILELLQDYPNKEELFIGGVDNHFSVQGNKFVAKLIADYLRDNNIIPLSK